MIAETILAALCCTTPLAMPVPPAQSGGQMDCPGTIRTSVSSTGQAAGGGCFFPTISADGRFTAFDTQSGNLVVGDNNGKSDVFLHDGLKGKTIRVSVSTDGDEGSMYSLRPSLSADGRFVAFESSSFNLVPGDTNVAPDIFLHDTRKGVTRRISVSSAGAQGDNVSSDASISADGRFVAFESWCSNLVPGDTNLSSDIMVHDTRTGTTTRVSVHSNGTAGYDDSNSPAISADGRFVAFRSTAWNLVTGDTNGVMDIFRHDRLTGKTIRVSRKTNGTQANGNSYKCSISADGRFVAFDSWATNLVAGDTNGGRDIFVHDTLTGKTTRVSESSNGTQGDSYSFDHTLSADGRFVAFSSYSANLVPGDANSKSDVFLHDNITGTTTRVSLGASGIQGNGDSSGPALSADGRLVVFLSASSNLIRYDWNKSVDVYVRCPGPKVNCYTTYCAVADGSLNNTSNLDATGCELAGPVRLNLTNGPAGKATFLMIGAGSTVVSNPGGALGDLCIVGGFLSRYHLDVGAINSAGSFSVNISNSASGGPRFGIPNSGSAIQAGQTWNFQYWHRNPIGNPAGFSEAIAITFF